MAKVYLTAMWKRQEEMRRHRFLLQAHEHVVTSRWLDEQPGTPEYTAAQIDIDDIDASDVLVAFTEKPDIGYYTGGRHIEVGYAIARSIPVIVVGPRENVFYHLPYIWRVDSIEDAIKFIGKCGMTFSNQMMDEL